MAYYADALDDVCSRFLINLPPQQLSDAIALGTEIEQAHWFYDDFLRKKDKRLPALKMTEFFIAVINHCPTLKHLAPQAEVIASQFFKYKMNVPTYGAALLSPDMKMVLMVTGKSSKWAVPSGKINKDEDMVECAIREVKEEVGYDIRGKVDRDLFIDVRNRRAYIIKNVPTDTCFATHTRNEITNIAWHAISDTAYFHLPEYDFSRDFLLLLGEWINTGSLPRSVDALNEGKSYRVAKRPAEQPSTPTKQPTTPAKQKPPQPAATTSTQETTQATPTKAKRTRASVRAAKAPSIEDLVGQLGALQTSLEQVPFVPVAAAPKIEAPKFKLDPVSVHPLAAARPPAPIGTKAKVLPLPGKQQLSYPPQQQMPLYYPPPPPRQQQQQQSYPPPLPIVLFNHPPGSLLGSPTLAHVPGLLPSPPRSNRSPSSSGNSTPTRDRSRPVPSGSSSGSSAPKYPTFM